MADTHRVDRTDRHLQFQSPYEGGGGYGGGGYKSMMPESGPSTTQVLSLLIGVPVVGSLLALAGLLLAGSVIGLMVALPLFLLFSPVIVPAALTIGLAMTGFLASGMFGLTCKYLRGTRRTVPEQLEYAKRRMADAVGYAGQKGKEMGQHVQSKAQDVKQYDISKSHDTTTKGHETQGRTTAA
ncbi:Oleosin [Arabidopsis thaliana x Arabidopsis arenosa]|uniref:Oleosin n=1 Tax=Arabidopsis thaliana x Arabidopsis arenosa TaxID=1240361 RepID=A0A8T1YDG3_9BRAS|nr:Oleosin [Arabidopsis thaliana x Arabidopsis arenosa]